MLIIIVNILNYVTTDLDSDLFTKVAKAFCCTLAQNHQFRHT